MAVDEYVKGQVVVLTDEITDISSSVLAADLTPTAASVSVAFAFGPASGQFAIQIDDEKMQVTAGAGTTTLTVTRGIDGTAAVMHEKDAIVSLVDVLVDDPTEAITVYRQDGTQATTTSIAHPATGVYRVQVTTDEPGYWTAVGKSTAGGAGAGLYRFFVIPTPG